MWIGSDRIRKDRTDSDRSAKIRKERDRESDWTKDKDRQDRIDQKGNEGIRQGTTEPDLTLDRIDQTG